MKQIIWEYLYIDVQDYAIELRELAKAMEAGDEDEGEDLLDGASDGAAAVEAEDAEDAEEGEGTEGDEESEDDEEFLEAVDEQDTTMALDSIGRDGWELVSFDWETHFAIFKRPIGKKKVEEVEDEEDDD